MRVTRILRAGHGPTNPFIFKEKFQTPKTSYQNNIPDPAWEKWVNMKNDYYKGFKFQRKNVIFLICLNIIAPAVCINVDKWEATQEISINDNLRGVPICKADRKPEDLWTIHTLKEYKTFDEPPIKISTWKTAD